MAAKDRLVLNRGDHLIIASILGHLKTYRNSALSEPANITSQIFEPPHDKTNKMACTPSEDSDQPGHLPSLIRVFAVRMKKA